MCGLQRSEVEQHHWFSPSSLTDTAPNSNYEVKPQPVSYEYCVSDSGIAMTKAEQMYLTAPSEKHRSPGTIILWSYEPARGSLMSFTTVPEHSRFLLKVEVTLVLNNAGAS